MNWDDTSDNPNRLQKARQYWDNAAHSFDDEPDHGLRDPQVLHAWTELLKTWLPAAPSAVLDVGCGTGSISVILAGLGHAVSGIDVSPAMVAQAQSKANSRGFAIPFQAMDASAPRFVPRSFDVVLCRHLLWALSEPAQVLQRWVDLLKPGGRLFLIEGYWSSGAGLRTPEVVAALPPSMAVVSIEDLSHRPEYWGKEITDERYAVIADLQPQSSIHKVSQMSLTFDDLYQQAKSVVNPRPLSGDGEAGSVGAALLAESGKVYTGVCIDTGSSMGFCAEHAAAAAMITAGESRVLKMIAVGEDGQIMPPCGRCREFISQLHDDNLNTEVMVAKDVVVTIRELLPHNWRQAPDIRS